MVFHYCEIHETDEFMTKLHPAEVQSFCGILGKDFNQVAAGFETLAGRIRPAGHTLETPELADLNECILIQFTNVCCPMSKATVHKCIGRLFLKESQI